MRTIDINCDLGEGFGEYKSADDDVLLDYVSSVNIACGYHAGEPGIMHKTVKNAIAKNLAIGAHPSFPDLQGFGRRNMMLSPAEIYQVVLYQVGALFAFVKAEGARLHHVKPHGALYNMAVADSSIAAAIVKAIVDFDRELVLYAPAVGGLAEEAQKIGLRIAAEAFTERGYMNDGSLAPRQMVGAVIHDVEIMRDQLRKLIRKEALPTLDGGQLVVRAETICLHSDNPSAAVFAKAIRETIEAEGFTLEQP